MTREDISELIRIGPPLTYVAEQLRISRPTIYRQMGYYAASEDKKIRPELRGYFDGLVMRRLTTEEDCIRYLEDCRGRADAEEESMRRDLERLRSEKRGLVSAMNGSDYMSPEEISKAKRRVNEIDTAVEGISKNLHMDSGNIHLDRLEWNPGEIRSVAHCPFGLARVYIDADYDRCRNITVELMVLISGEFFPCARYVPKENSRSVDIGEIMGGVEYRYRLLWIDNGVQKKAGPFPIVYEDY